IEKNDYMTLLLGKDGGVADIKDPSSPDNSNKINSSDKTEHTSGYGILLSCRNGTEDGTRRYYASFLNDNGKQVEYKTDRNYEDYLGRAAEFVFNDGVLVPEFLKNSSLSGVIDIQGGEIAGKNISDDCVFVDVTFIPDNDQAKSGYPADAKKIEFSEITANKINKGQVVYEKYDKNGDICFIAFNNITNSRYKYGMVTDYESKESSSWFDIDINGTVKRYTASLNVDIGRVPVMANIQKGKLLNLYALTEIKTSGKFVSIDSRIIRIGNTEYRLDKDFVIYTKDKNKKYGPIDIDDIDTANISSVHIYADKELENGGVVRIVVVA
ncbi:MAG: hypothetical protein J1F64_10825, partial [Oscillospiraceae bacterium]|nr:hypothetical protein [Oscillospiraceae bacterium]